METGNWSGFSENMGQVGFMASTTALGLKQMKAQAKTQTKAQAKPKTKVDKVKGEGKPRGTNNSKVKAAIEKGKVAHKEFADKVKQKTGWRSEPNLKDPLTGKKKKSKTRCRYTVR